MVFVFLCLVYFTYYLWLHSFISKGHYSSLWLNRLLLCIYRIFSLFVDQVSGLILAIVNSAVINVGMQRCLWYADPEFSRYIPRHCIAGLYSNYTFSLLRNFHSSILVVIVAGPVGILTNPCQH